MKIKVQFILLHFFYTNTCDKSIFAFKVQIFKESFCVLFMEWKYNYSKINFPGNRHMRSISESLEAEHIYC